MSDACAMVERCGRHQHPEAFGGHAVDTTCTVDEARAILEMVSERDPDIGICRRIRAIAIDLETVIPMRIIRSAESAGP